MLVEAGAGAGIGFSDDAYAAAGASVVDKAWEVWARSDLLVKVKEPLEPEYGLVRDEQTLFTYLHLAATPELTRVLLDSARDGDRVRDRAACPTARCRC